MYDDINTLALFLLILIKYQKNGLQILIISSSQHLQDVQVQDIITFTIITAKNSGHSADPTPTEMLREFTKSEKSSC